MRHTLFCVREWVPSVISRVTDYINVHSRRVFGLVTLPILPDVLCPEDHPERRVGVSRGDLRVRRLQRVCDLGGG